MRYIVVDSSKFTYPERFENDSASAEAKLDSAFREVRRELLAALS